MSELGNTFDLGRILMTAQSLQAMKRQANPNSLENRYLQRQYDNAGAEETRAAAQEGRDAAKFTQDQQWDNTELLHAAAAEVMQNPNAAQRWLPQLKQAGVVNGDTDISQVPPEQLQAMAQELFDSTSAALRTRKAKDLSQPMLGNVNPGDYTTESMAAYAETIDPATGHGDYRKLRRSWAPPSVVVRDVAGVPTIVDPGNRLGGGNSRPLSTLDQEAGAAGTIAGGTQAGKAEAERDNGYITSGLEAADALPVVKRGLELLAEVNTGGLDAAKLKATNLFGVTGADEAELSSNLGKAVLSQLRATFGAQFTEKEGQRLAEIEAGFGKSTEGNKRLLQQAEKILDRAARRGLDAAEKRKDDFSASEIRKSMGMSLSPNGPRPTRPGQGNGGGQFEVGKEYTDASGNKAVYRGNGQWEPR